MSTGSSVVSRCHEKEAEDWGIITNENYAVAFATQLRNILKVTTTDDDLMASRSSEIGLDSLVSLDIQSWFLRNLQVNTPVLKIMGNHTMSSLVEYAIINMPPELVPYTKTSQNGQGRENATGSSVSGETSTLVNELDLRTCIPDSKSPATGEGHEFNEIEEIDWETESTPPTNWVSIPLDLSLPPPSSPPNIIVLTGVTGFLGHHLLDYLLEHTSVNTVHCLAVRHLAARLRDKELKVNPRVKYYPGSLSDPLLGLSDQEAESIFALADVVIHNGADTSHVKLYPRLRASNVGSTKALIQLCLPRRVPLYYISSAGVALYSNRDSFPEISAAGPGSSYPRPDGGFGYGSSKWVSERLLERTHAQLGLPVCIHRPSTILREGADAAVPRAQLDWVNALLHYIRKLGAAPEIKHNRGALDLVRVETCCAAILRHAVTVRSGGTGSEPGPGLEYLHQVGDVVVPLGHLRDMDSSVGRRYGTLPICEWTARAVAAGLHPGVALLIEEMDSRDTPSYPRLLTGQGEIS